MITADFETQIAVYGFAEIDGTKITVNGLPDMTEDEARAYLKIIKEQYPQDIITSLEIGYAEDGNVDLSYTIKPPPFQRIRRITGYLVGTLDRFNNAKRKEESQRVKHSIENL